MFENVYVQNGQMGSSLISLVILMSKGVRMFELPLRSNAIGTANNPSGFLGVFFSSSKYHISLAFLFGLFWNKIKSRYHV